MVKASLNVNNVLVAIEKKQKQIERMKTIQLNKVGREQVVAAQTRIRDSKTDPNGKPWQPWAMATLKQRMRQGNASRGLLYRTGALLTSIQYRISNSKLTIFTNKPYGKYLQFGTPKMPARPFIGFGNQINNIINTLKEALK